MSPLTLSPAQRAQLIDSALQARSGSYSPYSNFRVGAALLAEGHEGQVVLGANVECASYGGTICAERTAIVKGVSSGHKRFIGLAVSSDVTAPISPCGICRQVLREFCPLDMPILLVPSDYSSSTPTMSAEEASKAENEGKSVIVETTMGEMLPLSFGPSHLHKPNP